LRKPSEKWGESRVGVVDVDCGDAVVCASNCGAVAFGPWPESCLSDGFEDCSVFGVEELGCGSCEEAGEALWECRKWGRWFEVYMRSRITREIVSDVESSWVGTGSGYWKRSERSFEEKWWQRAAENVRPAALNKT
jgi:hypothetical protein